MADPTTAAQSTAAAVDPFSPLLSAGVTGAVLLICMWALRSVYQQQIATLNATILAERERAKEQAIVERARTDRVEERLNALNEAVRERLITSMTSSAETFRETLRVLEGRSR
jgi:hypothetical protein